MDDIDDLLDEAEQSLNISLNCSQNKRKPSSRKSKLEEEIDDILEIEDDVTMKNTRTQKIPVDKRKCSTVPLSSGSKTKKCSAIYLGGSTTTRGLCSVSVKRCCDQLRCTNCDFHVEQYNNYKWDNTVDYLFFRNNMPDFQKVAIKLIKRSGSRAYACQCSWRSVDKVTPLDGYKLKWFCGKTH